MSLKNASEAVVAFYEKNGPCCAGCDHWRFYNSSVGDCLKSKIVSGKERATMIGIHGISMDVPSGHVMTVRSHLCANFSDKT